MKKTEKQKNIERKIVYEWSKQNVGQGEKNVYYTSKDIYKKFIFDTKASLSQGSFAQYFARLLKKLRIDHNILKKNHEGVYFGIKIDNLESYTQYLNLTKHILRYTHNSYITKTTDFGFFSEKLVEDWFSANLVVDKTIPEGLTITSLLHNYSTYYNLQLSPTVGLLSHFGKLLNKMLKRKHSYIATTTCRISEEGRIYPFLKIKNKS